MYRHPNARAGWNESFKNCLDKIYGVEKELNMLGDFNRDLFNTNIKRSWLDSITPFGSVSNGTPSNQNGYHKISYIK